MDTPKSKKLDVIIPAFRGHSQNFLMVLDGISEEDALKRIEGRTNHIIWMVGNFLDMRYAMANVLGVEEEFELKIASFRGKHWMKVLNIRLWNSLKQVFIKFHHWFIKNYWRLRTKN